MKLDEHPEVVTAFEVFRPTWEAWSFEYLRRERIQSVYAELFRLHTQVRKQGEILELVLGLGLLDWRDSSKGTSPPIQRHMVTARVDLLFDPATGIIQLNGTADGVQLRIEDDMLDAERRPERGQYAAVSEQLSAIDDDIWDRARTFTALKAWATVLHADCEWSPELASRHRGGREATGIRHGGARTFYAEGPDYVQMPPFESFHDAESHAATLAHELTHWTKHGKRLAREFGRQRWGDAGYAAEELVASLGRLSSVPISRSRPSRAPITPATSRHGWSF